MDEQGGAGGVPLEGEGKRDRRRKAHAERRDDRTTSAADTDEASRLDRPLGRPQQPEKPDGKGTRWVGPRGD